MKISSKSKASCKKTVAVGQPTGTEEDYLKTIHQFGGTTRFVLPKQVAAILGLRPPSVTKMFQFLHEAGWIDCLQGKGARLTDRGLQIALQVIRRQRLSKLLLSRVLGFDLSELNAEADALEHVISPRVEQALADYLGNPDEDPHGHPIPTAEGTLATRSLSPLASFRPGQQVRIREAADDDSVQTRRWQAMGLVPGAVVQILRYRQEGEFFEIQVGDAVIPIGAKQLTGLLAELASCS